MAILNPVETREIYMGTVPKGHKLLESLTAICKEAGVKLGKVEAIGAVQELSFAYYNQAKRVYEFNKVEKPLEIVSCIGNISLKDGQPLVHAHITASDKDGTCIGGHLAEGTVVFACEYVLYRFSGKPLTRGLDEATGLPLWTE